MSASRFVKGALTVSTFVALGSIAPAQAQSQPATPTATATAPQGPAAGERPAQGAPRNLTFDEALRLGEKENRDLQAARVRLKGAYSDVEKAIGTLLPTLTAQGKLTVNEPEVKLAFPAAFTAACQTNPMAPNCSGTTDLTITPRTQLDAVIAANVPILTPAALPALQAVKLSFEAQKQQLVVTAVQILTTVATSFYTAAGTEEVVTARRHAIEVAQKTVDNARIRLSAGVVNKVEVTRAELALIQAQQRLRESEDGRAAAYRALATLLNLPPGPLKVVPPPDPKTELLGEEELVNTAVKQRPELANLSLLAQSAAKQALAQGLRWLPSLSGFGNIRLTNASGFAGRNDFYTVGLQLDWMVFDGLQRDAARHAADAQRMDAELRLAQFKKTISDEVINARESVATRKVGLSTAERSVQMARETLELVRTQYGAGTATQLDLLTAQDQLVQAELGLAQARFDLSQAVLNLRKALGDTLLPS
ncbi:MAG: TolC family protein [Polyangia bacterium]